MINFINIFFIEGILLKQCTSDDSVIEYISTFSLQNTFFINTFFISFTVTNIKATGNRTHCWSYGWNLWGAMTSGTRNHLDSRQFKGKAPQNMIPRTPLAVRTCSLGFEHSNCEPSDKLGEACDEHLDVPSSALLQDPEPRLRLLWLHVVESAESR